MGEIQRKEIEIRDNAVINDGLGVGVVKIQPTNLDLKTDTETQAIHATFKELLETLDFPISIYSKQQETSFIEYIRHLKRQETVKTSLLKEYINYCRKLDQQTLVTTDHYITTKVSPNTESWITEKLPIEKLPQKYTEKYKENLVDKDTEKTVISEIDRRCRQITENLNTPDITAERLTGKQLKQVIKQYPGSEIAKPFQLEPQKKDGEYHKIAVIQGYPNSLELAWPLELFRLNGKIEIIQTIEPRNTTKTVENLNRIKEKLNAEIESRITQGILNTEKLESRLESTEWMLQSLTDRQEYPFNYSTYIVAHAKTETECNKTFKQLKNRLKVLGIDYKQPVFQTDKAQKTISPLHSDPLNESTLVLGSSAAAGLPFATRDMKLDSGVIYGINTANENPVLLDRYSWTSHSTVTMGATGSGKSYASKLELLRSKLTNPQLKIRVIDPKKEYQPIIDSLGGINYTLSPNLEPRFDNTVIGFETEQLGTRDNTELLIEAVRKTYQEALKNTEKTLVLIDEAHRILNRQQGRDILSVFVREARASNTALSIITQNASDFTEYKEGRDLLDNVPGKLFMWHERIPNSVIDYFNLSQQEKQEIKKLKTGEQSSYSEGILKVSNRFNGKIRIEANEKEHQIIQT